MDIRLDKSPPAVCSKGLARSMVKFDCDAELKAGRFKPQVESTGPREEADHRRYWH